GIEGVPGRHPMNRSLHLTAVGSVPAPRGRVVRAAELDDVARGALPPVGADDEVPIPQPNFPARREPEELLWWVFHEVFPLNPQLPRKRYLARPRERDVVRVIRR